jgi:glycosyltransferase involved in cell wall biosynthesis
MAIGARRVAELAKSLRDCGAKVSILGARADGDSGVDQSLAATLTGIETVTAWKGIAFVDKTYKWAKGLWNGVRSAGITAVSPSRPPEGVASRSKIRKLRDAYIHVHCALDRRKQWAFWALLRSVWLGLRSGRFHMVIASAPPSAAFVVGYMHCKLFSSTFIMDLRDPWLFELARVRARIESPLERACVAAAATVVCASPGIAKDLASRRPEYAAKFEVVYNGYDRLLPSSSRSAPNTLTMLFAGALYAGRDPFPFLRALYELISQDGIERGRIRVQFVGSCHWFGNESVLAWVDKHDLSDVVQILGMLSSKALDEMFKDADVLINFSQNQHLAIPAKTFEYLGSTKEILLIAENGSDTAGVLREAKRGIIVEPTDDAALKDALETLYRRYVVGDFFAKPDLAASAAFSRERQNGRYVKILRDALAGRADARTSPSGPRASARRSSSL